jgi:outer membrane lipoprotein carrier protein
MNRIIFSIALVVCGLFFCQSINAQSGPARAHLERFSSGLTTLQAGFEQKVIGSDGAVQDASSGKVWLQRPRLFRWEYGGDFPELVVADGRNVWIYDETLEQVTIKDQSKAAVNSPLTLLTDPSRLDEQFDVREVGSDGTLDLLELRARGAEVEFERILLGLGDDGLVLMIMEDVFGLRTELRFRDIERNPVLDAGLFTFEPPETADVIGSPASF